MMKSLQNPWAASILLLAVLAQACSLARNVGGDPEVNLAFHFDRNQLVLDGVEIDGHAGRFVIGTAYPTTLIGSSFATRHDLSLTRPFTLVMRDIHTVEVAANVADLGGEMDAIIGADVLAPVIVIDYQNGLITRFSRSLPPHAELTRPWKNVPRYPLTIEGRDVSGVIDTASPDTLLVPRSMLPDSGCDRCEVDVTIAGVQLHNLDVRAADVEEIVIGNRILERFLVTIDYRKKRATLEPR